MSASKRGTGPVGNALGPSLGPNRCDISDYHLQSFNQPIQHSRPACSKRNSHERLLALALGVKMVVCLGPLLVLASVIVIACYSAATNDVLNAVLPDSPSPGEHNRVLSLLVLRFSLFGIYVNCFESALSTGAIESGSSS